MKFDEFHIENRPKLVYSSLKLLDEHIPFLLSILLQGLNSIQSYVLFSSVDCSLVVIRQTIVITHYRNFKILCPGCKKTAAGSKQALKNGSDPAREHCCQRRSSVVKDVPIA